AGGGSPGWHVLGRETFLAPVTWADGWPVIGPVEPVEAAPPWPLQPFDPEPVRDDFDADRLGPAWLSLRERPETAVSTRERPGRLTLHGRVATLDTLDVAFAGRRQQHRSCVVRARVEVDGGQGG